MKKVALIFPGQGSQAVGMGKDFYEDYGESRAVFDAADSILGYPLSKIIFEGPDEKLKETLYTQPAVFTVSAAMLAALKKSAIAAGIMIEPVFAAGHSLGEYTALYSAGVFDIAPALSLVKSRAGFIQDASVKIPGTMAAILGLDEAKTAEVCAASGAEAVNFNSPGQIVVAGAIGSVEKAMTFAKEKGALKTVRLNVSGAFHSSLMKDAAQKMAAALESANLVAAHYPIVMNVDAAPERDASAIKQKLVSQIDHPVLWENSVRAMIAAGVELFVEIGPGKVLTGLIKRIERKAAFLNIATVSDIAAVIAVLR
ncbi:MAG: ACP S-malonyltransferase [Endomicrobiia bacterium]|nr:ACP S-malonyltransferase [Endomicrobiia bacterium]